MLWCVMRESQLLGNLLYYRINDEQSAVYSYENDYGMWIPIV